MGLGLGLELELGLGVRVGVKTCVIRPDRPYHAPHEIPCTRRWIRPRNAPLNEADNWSGLGLGWRV